MCGYSIKDDSEEDYINVDLKQSNGVGKENYELNQIKTNKFSKFIF